MPDQSPVADPARAARPAARLVRRPRPRPALARAVGVAVGGDGQRVHAAADPRRAGAAGLRAVAAPRWPTPGRPGGRPRPATRCAPGAGSATRAARCGCTPPRPRSSSGTAARCPSDYDDLLALPGVGDYTAAAVASFAFRPPARRARHQRPPGARPHRARRRVPGDRRDPRRARPRDRAAARRRPDRGGVGGRDDGARRDWSAWPRSPRCDDCPVADLCAWRAAGYPAYDGPARRGQAYDGTDRQCRGRLLGVLRDSDGPVHRSAARGGVGRRRAARPVPAVAGRRRPGGPRRRGRPTRCPERARRSTTIASARSSTAWSSTGSPGSSGRSSWKPMKAASSSAVARPARVPRHPGGRRGGRRPPRPTRRWPRRTTRDVGLAPEQPERGGLDVHPLAARQPRVSSSRPRGRAPRPAPSADGGSARSTATDRSLETRSTVATRSSLLVEVVEQHPVAGAELGGHRPQAQPDQAVLEDVVGGRLRDLVATAGLPWHGSPRSGWPR